MSFFGKYSSLNVMKNINGMARETERERERERANSQRVYIIGKEV